MQIARAASLSRGDRGLSRLWSRLDLFGPYAPLAVLFLVGLPLLSCSRAALMVWQAQRVAATGIWPELLLQGVRVDLIQLGLLAMPLVALAPVLAVRPAWRAWRWLCYFWVIVAILLLAFLESAAPAFITEYDTRPNRLFVEYLKYPREVAATLVGAFLPQLIGGVVLSALAVAGVAWLMRPWLRREASWSYLRLWLTWPLIGRASCRERV